MIKGRRVTVIIPALNEARAIGNVIGDLQDFIDDIIVVDNGSTDGTALEARAAGARVVVEPMRGYGAACLAGIRDAGHTDLFAFIDGDYSDYPEELVKIVTPVATGELDLAMGARPGKVAGRAVMPWHQRRVVGMVHGYCYEDFGPMRCITRDLLEKLEMRDTNYGWTAEMQLKASMLQARVGHIDVSYRNRIGQSKISGTIKGTGFAASKILYWTFRLSFDPVTPATRKSAGS